MDIKRLAVNASFATFGHPSAYQGRGFIARGIRAVLRRDYEVYDEGEQLARRIITIAVRVADVPQSERGDVIHHQGDSWRVQSTIEDDGHERIVEVT